jgi:methyltransferase-like protein/SAM-dependent methyltransferase
MPISAPPISYDELPYPGLCYTQTHPGRLAACARLLGLAPAPVTRCRVLELGCASGGNLLPMAYALPESTFIGIDLSARQIAEATETVRALGLGNIAFLAMDIRDISADLGEFDYIIAHGLYSWVPPEVRDSLLATCRANLAPQGVAYVSYNAYPGWHTLLGLREMMLYHTRNEHDPHQRAEQARALIAFLRDAVADERNRAYGTFIEGYHDLLELQLEDARPRIDAALLHDELEEHNDPVYFWQFAEHAARHGLQFLVEADFPLSMPNNLSDEVVGALQGICETIVDTEQYMDFIRNRTFRRTLLCHAHLAVERTLRTARVRELAVSTRAVRLADEPEGTHPGAARYRSPDGAIFQTDHPLTIAALDCLVARAPQALPFATLAQAAAQRLGQGAPPDDEVTHLAANLLKAFTYSLSLVEFHGYTPTFVTSASERPVASALARYQARESDRVANLRHERVHLDPLGRYILPHLDGRHTREDLLALLDDLIAKGALRLRGEGDEAPSMETLRRRIQEELDHALAWLARAALLVG